MNVVQKIVALALMGASLMAYADLKLGVVNIQNVFEQVPQGQQTVKNLQDSLAPDMNKLKNQQVALNKEMSTFNRNSPTLSVKERQAQQEKLAMKQEQFQKSVDQLKSSEGQKQQNAAALFQADLVTAINKVAKSGSYDMIMTDQTLPFYGSSFDVSEEVIQLMKAMPTASSK